MPDWQSGGRKFESCILHQKKPYNRAFFFVSIISGFFPSFPLRIINQTAGVYFFRLTRYRTTTATIAATTAAIIIYNCHISFAPPICDCSRSCSRIALISSLFNLQRAALAPQAYRSDIHSDNLSAPLSALSSLLFGAIVGAAIEELHAAKYEYQCR